MSIHQWPVEQRPRERLIKYGAATLSDAELLAIFLRVGVAGQSAVSLAQQLHNHFGTLGNLFNASLADFSRIKGMGPAKFTQLQAILELARRSLQETLQTSPVIDSPQRLKEYLRLSFGHKKKEYFAVLLLDASNQLIACETLSIGTLTEANVYPREVVKIALFHNACSVILVHNHPSGSCDPSPDDNRLTATLQQALSLIDIRVLDHFIVSSEKCFSYEENGVLPKIRKLKDTL